MQSLEERKRRKVEESKTREERRRRRAQLALAAVIMVALGVGTLLIWQKETETAKAYTVATEEATAALQAQRAERKAKEKVQQSEQALRIELERSRRDAHAVAVAHASSLWKRDPESAFRLLQDVNACPLDLRSFTWRWFDALSRRAYFSFRTRSSSAKIVLITPDSKMIATSEENTDELLLWEVRTGKRTASIPYHTKGCKPVFSLKGNLLAMPGIGIVRVFDTRSGNQTFVAGGFSAPIRELGSVFKMSYSLFV